MYVTAYVTVYVTAYVTVYVTGYVTVYVTGYVTAYVTVYVTVHTTNVLSNVYDFGVSDGAEKEVVQRVDIFLNFNNRRLCQDRGQRSQCCHLSLGHRGSVLN